MNEREMTQEREARLLERAVSLYGEQAQIDMMIEEMSELTKALCKYKRAQTDRTVAAVREEMADVQIMLDQMALVFGDFNEEEIAKLERLEERLEERCKQEEEAMDWDAAMTHLETFEAEYRKLPIGIGAFGLMTIANIKARFENGERTKALYEDMMGIE